MPVVLALTACAVCFAAGALIALHMAGGELRRMARFLSKRDRMGNGRLTVELPGRTFGELAEAVNGELDAMQEERIEARRYREEFQRELASLSHDVRTPLMGAKGRMQLARGEEDAEARAAHLDAAAARLDDVEALLDQLFDYARANDPDVALDLAPVEVFPLVAHVLAGQYTGLGQAGLEPDVSFEDEGFSVEADAHALSRMVENIVANAVRYGVGERLGVRQRGRELAFSNRVADPHAIDAARLFDRFYRADGARVGKGSGIGLAVVASLAAAQGFEAFAELAGDELTVGIRF